jgi:hypothetical protein
MLSTNTKVKVYSDGVKETGLVLDIQEDTAFIKLDTDGVILPFDLGDLEIVKEDV